MRPAGLQNSVGVISTSFLKDAADVTWKNNPAIKEWLAFMDEILPNGDKEDGNAIFRLRGSRDAGAGVDPVRQ